MNAECLACAAGMTVEHIAESPDTTGCAEDDGPTAEQGESGAALSSTVLIAAARDRLWPSSWQSWCSRTRIGTTHRQGLRRGGAMFNEWPPASVPTCLSKPRSRPGEMYDGYEGLEYPPALIMV